MLVAGASRWGSVSRAVDRLDLLGLHRTELAARAAGALAFAIRRAKGESDPVGYNHLRLIGRRHLEAVTVRAHRVANPVTASARRSAAVRLCLKKRLGSTSSSSINCKPSSPIRKSARP
jgi:hypothetical protein